jgi:ketosteroid isomerase-like protein
MSHENVETVRDSWRALADGGLDALTEFWDPEIDWRAIEGAPDDVGEMRGREAVRRYLQDWVDTFDGLTVVAEELLELNDQRVVAVIRVSGRAKLSGIETELRLAVVYSLRDGKIVPGREYIDREQALEAVGVAKH